jgi:hypothetical protein
LERSPQQCVHEHIVLIGGENELAARAQSHGYSVDHVSPEQLKAQYGIEAAPLLAVVDPQRRVRYAGGYTARKQVLDIHDLAIITDLMNGQRVSTLPVYGCAVSKSLQEIVDPLGIKASSAD